MNSYFPILCFPKYEFRFKSNNNSIFIFDDIRRKWIVCTPEEWVRQNLINFLIKELLFPKSLIAVEKSITLAGKNLRFDALVYDKKFNPLVLIECKAPSVNITQSVFDQILSYNYEINAPYFILTNGFAFIMGSCYKSKKIIFFHETKNFEELLIQG